MRFGIKCEFVSYLMDLVNGMDVLNIEADVSFFSVKSQTFQLSRVSPRAEKHTR